LKFIKYFVTLNSAFQAINYNFEVFMQVTPLSKLLVNVDNIANYIPVASTVTNLVDLFQKCVLLFVKDEAIKKSHYFSHINDKKALRCVVLLVPVFGNIIVGYIDWQSKNRIQALRRPIHENVQPKGKEPIAIGPQLPKQIECNQELLKALEENEDVLKDASNALRDDPIFMKAASHRTVFALKYASDRLKDDKGFMLEEIEESANALMYASERLRNDKNFLIEAVKRHPQASMYIGEDIKNNQEAYKEVLAAST
jgi:Domain of unknown function (DUF4116)